MLFGIEVVNIVVLYSSSSEHRMTQHHFNAFPRTLQAVFMIVRWSINTITATFNLINNP
jgi:hypothetical protein